MIDLLGYCQGFWLLAIQTLTRLDPKVQLQLLVNPADPLVVPFKAFNVTQVEVTKTKTPVAVVVRKLKQPIRNLRGLKLKPCGNRVTIKHLHRVQRVFIQVIAKQRKLFKYVIRYSNDLAPDVIRLKDVQ